MSTRTHLLEVISPAGQVDFYPLEPGQTTQIGQRPGNQIVIADPALGPVQAVVLQNIETGRCFWVSQAGETTVNGQALPLNTPVELNQSSIIQFAGYTLLLLPHQPAAAPRANRPLPAESATPQPVLPKPTPPPRLPGATTGVGLNLLLALGLILLIALAARSTIGPEHGTVKPAPSGPAEPFDRPGPLPAASAPDFGESALPFTAFPGSGSRAQMSYETMFREIALQYQLDWRLLAGVAYQESRLNPWAIGRDNDLGLMQILPSTWDEWAPQVGVADPFDPYSNVSVAAAYLAYLRDYCQARGYPEIQWMLIGYNWGPDNLRRLFAQNGGWAQVPEKQRRYALQILQSLAAGPNGPDDPFKKEIDISLKDAILNFTE